MRLEGGWKICHGAGYGWRYAHIHARVKLIWDKLPVVGVQCVKQAIVTFQGGSFEQYQAVVLAEKVNCLGGVDTPTCPAASHTKVACIHNEL